VRLFVALDIPQAVREALTNVVRSLRDACPDARWVRLEGVHVTLKFIGEVSPDLTGRIRETLPGVPPAPNVDLRFAGLGFFPTPRRPRVLWAGVEHSDALPELAASIEARLEPLGIVREKRGFQPHVTLARLDSARNLDALRSAVEKLGRPEFGRATPAEFHLYRSLLKPGGAEYTRLASYRISTEPAH
jgi:2'-5' RNA ligase